MFRCRCLSAEAGNSIGQNNLGLCYEHGKGVDIDLGKAFYWYEKSAEGGDLTGQNSLLTAQFCDENCNCLRRNYLPVDHTRLSLPSTAWCPFAMKTVCDENTYLFCLCRNRWVTASIYHWSFWTRRAWIYLVSHKIKIIAFILTKFMELQIKFRIIFKIWKV